MPGSINRRKMDMAWEILQANPGMTHDKIAIGIQEKFNLSKPPLRTTVTNWICFKRKEIKREKLKEYARNIAIRILRRDFCKSCYCLNQDSGRCHYAWETEMEIIDLLAEKVFCDYFQKRGRLEGGSVDGIKTNRRMD